MPIYFILIILAIIVVIFSGKIDEKVNANGKLKKVFMVSCVGSVLIFSSVIKTVL